jgi:TolB protein
MRRLALAAAIVAVLGAQQPDLKIDLLKPAQAPALAVPDFRGDAQSQSLMAAFNETLWRDLDDSAYFQMVPKTRYPTGIPQQPSDLRPQEWSAAPAQATYLAMGYSAVQNGLFMLRGWLMDVRNSTAAGAQLFEQRYAESVDVAGARQAAHRFAADILAKLGATSLLGTHIYFVHESRPAPDRRTEIRMMDYDGANQRPIARGDAIFTQPAVSPDGSKVAFSQVFPKPELILYSGDPLHAVLFRNQKDLSAVGSPSVTPDGKQIVFAQSVNGHPTDGTLSSCPRAPENPRSGLWQPTALNRGSSLRKAPTARLSGADNARIHQQ